MELSQRAVCTVSPLKAASPPSCGVAGWCSMPAAWITTWERISAPPSVTALHLASASSHASSRTLVLKVMCGRIPSWSAVSARYACSQ